jgi:HAE1 family hydrophobic/amphiphilic exporter-1
MNYIRERIPPDSSLEVVENEGPFIQQALDELKVDILWGSLLAFGVLLVFLGNLWSTFLIMLTIPVSVVSTFALMSFYGVSLNMMSIGGMALGVGMLVDCSIVVLEAIHRKQGSASDVYSSISSALTEVGPSIVSGTLTSLAVLVPILFMTGIAQKLFRDFALTMGSSLFFSLLVSIFLLPAISVLIKTSSNRSHDDVGFMQPLNDLYKHSLTLALDNPRKVIAATVALVLLATSGIYRVGFELFPNLNLDVFDVNITLEPGSSLNKLEERIDSVENIIGTMPEVRNYVTKAGVDRNRSAMDASLETGKINEARINVRLNPQSSGRNETDTVIGELKRQIKPIDGAKIDFTLTQGPIARILGAGDKPELLRISGDNFDELQRLSSELENVLVTNKHISGMSWEGNVRTDHYQIVVDRYKAASTGVTVDDIAHAVKAGIEGKNVGKFIQGDHEHDIRVRLKTREKTSPDDLENLALRSIHDDFSVLGRLATVSTGHGPREIIRSDRQRNVILHGAISGIAASDAERIVMDAARRLELPPGYSARPGASRMELMESMGNLSIAILLASLLVYTILVIQFESLIWPLLVFTVVPASMIGPAIALNVGNHPVNIFVLIGTVVLIGIVVNMGILMVATINEFRESGSTLRSAIINGCAVRLWPILMTTATTVFGALPICVASGVANQLNQPLAITIISGLLASTVFKLYGLPVLYEIVAESRQSLKS